MKIVVSTFPFPEQNLAELQTFFGQIDFVFPKSKDDLIKEVVDADAIISMVLKEDQIKNAPRLKWIQTLSAGVEAYPLDYIQEKEILLTTSRGIHKVQMSEYAISMMVIAARRLDRMIVNQRQRLWDRNIPQNEIYGKTLGIIGLGSIGQEIAKKADLMGMSVLGIKNTPTPVPHVKAVMSLDQLPQLVSTCDYIINLLPHTQATHHIINEAVFNKMKSDGVMINMGRGATVKQADLVTALKNKIFRLYISDVFEKEPIPEDDPLWSMDNLIITPHICGPNVNYMEKAMGIIKKNIEYFIEGKSLENVYSFDKGY
jgi:phosphoglycerate dehydrogenase-like enzyme